MSMASVMRRGVFLSSLVLPIRLAKHTDIVFPCASFHVDIIFRLKHSKSSSTSTTFPSFSTRVAAHSSEDNNSNSISDILDRIECTHDYYSSNTQRKPCKPRKPRTVISWTPELDAAIHQLRQQGHTWNSIGKSLNLVPTTCSRRYYAVIVPELTKYWTPELSARLRELVLQSRPWGEIATEMTKMAASTATSTSIPILSEKSSFVQISAISCEEHWYRIAQQPFRLPKEYHPGHASPDNFRKRDQKLLQDYLNSHYNRQDSQHKDQLNAKNQSRDKDDGDETCFDAQNHAVVDWEDMARSVFQNRFTPEQLQFQHSLLLKNLRRWTKKQDAQLTDFIMEHMQLDILKKQRIWIKISSQLGHSIQECKDRWQHYLKPKLVKQNNISKSGHIWSEDEVIMYWSKWLQVGNDWNQISMAVQSVVIQGSNSHTPPAAPSNEGAEGNTIQLKKLPVDCRDDFNFLVSLSRKMVDRLRDALGDIACEFFEQPLRRHGWTGDQLKKLHEAVRHVAERPLADEKKKGVDDSSMIPIADIDWRVVAKQVGHGITGAQCQYRWLSHVLRGNRNNALRGTGISPNQNQARIGQWNLMETEELTRALQAHGFLGVVRKLPRGALTTIRQDCHGLNRTIIAIRSRANKILRNSHISKDQKKNIMVQDKALVRLQFISRGTKKVNAASNTSSGTEKADSEDAQNMSDGPKIIADASQGTTEVEADQADSNITSDYNNEEEDSLQTLLSRELLDTDGNEDEEDLLGQYTHPEMFISPGILKSSFKRKRSSSAAIRTHRSNYRITWLPKDEDKLLRLVGKYGQSGVAWIQIGREMSIPAFKCKLKWTQSLNKSKEKHTYSVI